MKRGGQVIYTGPLGHQSHMIVEYLEVRFPFSLCGLFQPNHATTMPHF